MTLETMRLHMQENIALIENTMQDLMPQEAELPQKNLVKAMRYAVEAGGKRIRPMLALEFCRLCGGDDTQILPAACAIELYHTSSLVHDDMPELDDDAMRRGKPACHIAFGASTALLAGDAMMMQSISWIAEQENLSADRKVALIQELAAAGGVHGVLGGQQIDVEHEGSTDVTLEELTEMYAMKTGSLIVSACKMGCMAAGADAQTMAIAEEYGQKLGLAFQIVDDILDVTAEEETLGKPIGSDIEQQKSTFVSHYGLEQAKAVAAKLTVGAMTLLSKLPQSDFLCSLTKYLLVRQF